MNNWLWTDGRFAWPPVIAVAVLTAFVVAADLLWRLATLPFERMLLLIGVAGLAVAFGVYRLLRRHLVSLSRGVA